MPLIRDTSEACRQLESLLVRQLIVSSGAFKGSALAGSSLQTDMFVDALAEAVAKGGGLGLSDLLEKSLPENPEGDVSPTGFPASVAIPHSTNRVTRPTNGTTSGFGLRTDPIDGTTKYHTGIDLRGAEGDPIHAVAPGIVMSAGPRGGYGNAIEIDHGNGLSTLYAHASALAVRPGDRVAKNQEIAAVGHTGRSTGPHLHFEVREDGRPMNPQKALNTYRNRVEETVGGEARLAALNEP